MIEWERFKVDDAGSYDAAAAAYATHIEVLARPLAEALARIAGVSPGNRVLDVGCGTGVGTRTIAAAVGSSGLTMGVDLSRGMLDEAERRTPDRCPAEFRHMDAERLDLADESFDAVVSLCAILHFPDIDRAITEMKRVLRPGGTLVVSYGAGRPPGGPALVAHALRRSRERFGGAIFAPAAIQAEIASLPRAAEPVLTSWAGTDPRRALTGAIRRAGFRNLHTSWTGADHEFSDAGAFWDAQATIVTEARRALENAAPDQAGAIRAKAVERWRVGLESGRRLVYPYGAVYVRATAP